MNINIQAPFSLTEQQRESLKSMASDLQKYEYGITNITVYFKKDDGNIPNGILAEIEVHVPGPVIFASEVDNDYLVAFSKALDKVDRQIRKAKDIRVDHHS